MVLQDLPNEGPINGSPDASGLQCRAFDRHRDILNELKLYDTISRPKFTRNLGGRRKSLHWSTKMSRVRILLLPNYAVRRLFYVSSLIYRIWLVPPPPLNLSLVLLNKTSPTDFKTIVNLKKLT